MFTSRNWQQRPLHLKVGRVSLEDDESMSTTHKNVKEIERIGLGDCWITIREVADIVNMSFRIIQAIFMSNLNMHCVSAKSVPRLLIPEQKQHCVEICEDLHQQA